MSELKKPIPQAKRRGSLVITLSGLISMVLLAGLWFHSTRVTSVTKHSAKPHKLHRMHEQKAQDLIENRAQTAIPPRPRVTPDALDQLARLELPKSVRRFKELQTKAVRTEAEKQELLALFDDTATFTNIKTTLMEKQGLPQPALDRRRRMAMVDFLAAGLTHCAGEGCESLLSQSSAIILANNLTLDVPIGMRKAIAGDKLELLKIMSQVAPDRIHSLVENGQGTSNAMLLNFALREFESYRLVAADGTRK